MEGAAGFVVEGAKKAGEATKAAAHKVGDAAHKVGDVAGDAAHKVGEYIPEPVKNTAKGVSDFITDANVDKTPPDWDAAKELEYRHRQEREGYRYG